MDYLGNSMHCVPLYTWHTVVYRITYNSEGFGKIYLCLEARSHHSSRMTTKQARVRLNVENLWGLWSGN